MVKDALESFNNNNNNKARMLFRIVLFLFCNKRTLCDLDDLDDFEVVSFSSEC